MAVQSGTAIIGKRYILHDQLGAGGMGAVHRASDRLSGKTIALKRVTTPTEHIDFSSRGQGTDLRIALANEFKTLASVRHPNIISVLDYGFDAHRQPFFTMNLLDKPQTIVQAGQGQPLEAQTRLLTALLQALAYLHRRNIIHRDLKPANVMVIKDTQDNASQVKVLDFGLSIVMTQVTEKITERMSGTLAYMAPELFQGRPASKASDLYAVGLMAYEIFAGRYPFGMNNIAVLINSILNVEADLSACRLETELTAVLARLLAKNPAQRYENADDVIGALCIAAQQSLPTETIEIRESFLQAARFVGREHELSELSVRLSEALAGKGSTCLVAGESGIGKSRLLEELRTLALVEGALVIRGQAVSDGGSAYQVWRDVLRWLSILEDVTSEEASILKVVVPDIAALLGQDIPDAAVLDPQAAQQRLLATVISILRRQKQPVVLILEDLQWAGSESITMLERISQIVANLPLFIVGNYRDDERPDLPRELPAIRLLKLYRLTQAGVALLSESMLGAKGRQPELVSLLQRETEGNIFFVVEMLRALAEEAGELGMIGRKGLPEKILAGGVQQIIQRGLDRVPPEARPLLQRAAALGRQLNLAVLRALDPVIDVDKWLEICAGAAVLDVQERRWRFAHDKLREAVLAGIPENQTAPLHREVALALELVHPNVGEYASRLAYLWHVAKDTTKELYYAQMAGEQASLISANVEAVGYFNRALELLKTLPETPEHLTQVLGLEITLGASLAGLKGWGDPDTERAYTRAYELSQRVGETPLAVWFGQWVYSFMRSGSKAQEDRTYEFATQIRGLAERSEDADLLVASDHAMGNTLSALGQLSAGLSYYKRTFSVRDLQRRQGLALRFGHDPLMICMAWGAQDLTELGYPNQGINTAKEAIVLGKELAHPASLAIAMSFICWTYATCREWKAVQEHAEAAIAYTQEHQLGYWLAFSTIFRGAALAKQGQLAEGIEVTRQGLAMMQTAGCMVGWRFWLQPLAEAHYDAGQFDLALNVLEDGLAGDWDGVANRAEFHRLKGEVLRQQGVPDAEVEQQFLKALEIARGQSAKWWELRTSVSLCRFWQNRGKKAEARTSLASIYSWFTEGFDMPDLREAKALLNELS